MDWHKYKQKVFWVIVTIILGAIGSGLWEVALKPALSWIVTASIDTLSNVFHSLSDAIYEDLARGKAERIEKTLLAWGTGGVMGLWLMLVMLRRYREKGATPKTPTLSTKTIYLGAIFVCSFTLFNSSKTLFILDKINNFEQLVAITTPYLGDEEASKVRSEFNQIHTKEEYSRLMKKLRGIAKANKLYLPKHLKDTDS